MKRNPRLQLPEDPNVNIWNYYPIMKITPVDYSEVYVGMSVDG